MTLYLPYHFAVCAHSISKRCGTRFANLLLGSALSVVRKRFMKRKHAFMLRNLKLAIPGKGDEEYEEIIQESVEHMLRFLARNFGAENRSSRTRTIANEELIDSIVSGNEKGAVVITSHQGDWENLIQYFKGRDDLDACNLYRKPSCKNTDRFLRKFRGIDQCSSGYGIIKKFKCCESRKVFALIGVDQKPFNKGVQVDFLKRPTKISPICVQIAQRMNIPIVIAKTLIVNGKTEISFRKVDTSSCAGMSKDDTVQLALQLVMNEISRDIVDHPGQWVMWAHNFWKTA